MVSNKLKGDDGEKEIVEKVSCPNCNKKLMCLPPNYPLVDIQCIACNFRAQVKTINSKPKCISLGAGWDIMHKVLKSGYMVPPTFFNFKWANGEKQEIRFYPFIPRLNLRKYQLSHTAKRSNYRMFNYIGLDKLPYFVMYEK